MRSHAGMNKSHRTKAIAVQQENAVMHHVGNVKEPTVWRDTYVLGHAGRRELQTVNHPPLPHIELDEIAAKFAAEDGVAPVYGKISVIDAAALRRSHRLLKLHRVRVAEIQPPVFLRDNNRGAAVRREIKIV